MNNKRRKTIKWSKWMVLLLACIWAFITIFPFFFMVLSSFKQSSEMFMNGVFSLPEHFSLANYAEVLERRFGIYFKNSGLTLLLSLVGILVISSLASYVFARLESKWTNRLLAVVVACMSIPIHIALYRCLFSHRNFILMIQFLDLWGHISRFISPSLSLF